MGALAPNDFSIVLAISILWLEVAILFASPWRVTGSHCIT
jgi:hypothetical protein